MITLNLHLFERACGSLKAQLCKSRRRDLDPFTTSTKSYLWSDENYTTTLQLINQSIRKNSKGGYVDLAQIAIHIYYRALLHLDHGKYQKFLNDLVNIDTFKYFQRHVALRAVGLAVRAISTRSTTDIEKALEMFTKDAIGDDRGVSAGVPRFVAGKATYYPSLDAMKAIQVAIKQGDISTCIEQLQFIIKDIRMTDVECFLPTYLSLCDSSRYKAANLLDIN